MPDSSAIDNALMAKLGADATLLGLMPNGVFWDVAPPNSTRFVIVSLVDPHDERVFEGRSIEAVTYAVKAMGLSSANPNMQAAAARIDALLEGGTLTVAGYVFMAMYRDENNPRIRTTEVDAVDTAIRWYHRGANYHVEMSVGAT